MDQGSSIDENLEVLELSSSEEEAEKETATVKNVTFAN